MQNIVTLIDGRGWVAEQTATTLWSMGALGFKVNVVKIINYILNLEFAKPLTV